MAFDCALESYHLYNSVYYVVHNLRHSSCFWIISEQETKKALKQTVNFTVNGLMHTYLHTHSYTYSHIHSFIHPPTHSYIHSFPNTCVNHARRQPARGETRARLARGHLNTWLGGAHNRTSNLAVARRPVELLHDTKETLIAPLLLGPCSSAVPFLVTA